MWVPHKKKRIKVTVVGGRMKIREERESAFFLVFILLVFFLRFLSF